MQNDQAVIPVGAMSPGRTRSSVSGFFDLPSSSRSWKDRLARGGSRLLLVLAVLFGVLAISLVMLRGIYSDRVYPQVSVAGMNIGGMSREDALLSLERHATSKLRDAGGLAAIRTLGFRGEAVPSIASE